jgi:hypothetical protein
MVRVLLDYVARLRGSPTATRNMHILLEPLGRGLPFRGGGLAAGSEAEIRCLEVGYQMLKGLVLRARARQGGNRGVGLFASCLFEKNAERILATLR